MEPRSNRLFQNAQVFSEDYRVSSVRSRDEQLKQLRSCLAPAFRNAKALHALLVGPTGTGKTLVAKATIDELSSKGVLSAYVNCTQHATLHAVLDKVVSDLRIIRSERNGIAFKLEQLEKFLKGRPLVLVLDEIDRIRPKNRTELLYSLASRGNFSLVSICSETRFVATLEEAVRSRFSPTIIEFPPYELEELHGIILNRAKEGLLPNCCPDDVVYELAMLADGDARSAIQALRTAALNAGQRGSSHLDAKDAHHSIQDGAELKREQLLASLNDHQRALVRLIEEFGEISSVRLWHEYQAECERIKLTTVSARTFAEYVTQLTLYGLAEEVRTKNNARVLRAVRRKPRADADRV